MPSVDISVAKTDDATAMRAIAAAAYQPYIAEIGRPPAPMLADFGAHINEDMCFVLRVGGVVCGYAIIIEKSDGYWLENIAVHPEKQGCGNGLALLKAAEDYLAPHASFYQLYTNIAMHSNIIWYQRLGFKKIREVQVEGFRRIYFKKKL